MDTSLKTIQKIKKTELYYEMITWGAIIIATVYTAINFSYSEASDSLLYVLIGATIASTFWYLRSRRLYVLALKNAEAAVQKSRELQKQQQTSEIILEHTSDGILILDNEKRIINFSKGLEKMSGFKKTAMLGKVAGQVLKFTAKPDVPSILDIIFLPKDFVRRKYRIGSFLSNSLETQNGNLIDVEMTHDTFRDPVSNQTLGLIMLRNVTYEQEIRERDREFVSMASHQIFTPLSMIRGFLSLLLEGDKGKLNQTQKLYADKAYEATKSLVSFVGSLLSTSRIEGERVKLEIKKFDIAQTIKHLAEEFIKSKQTRGNKLLIDLPARPILIEADEEKISQAINNCLDNAIKYTDKGEVKISTQVTAGMVRVEIADNGIGIPQGEVARIGTKFFRAENAVKRDTRGTGLGMFVAFYLVEKHHGNIEITSKENEGTKVKISLPQTSQ